MVDKASKGYIVTFRNIPTKPETDMVILNAKERMFFSSEKTHVKGFHDYEKALWWYLSLCLFLEELK
jgi:hypothetical protein